MSERAVQRRGFTLMEVLLALALIVLLFGALYAFSSQAAASRKRLDTEASAQRNVTDLFDAIERAGLTSVAGDAVVGAGVAGTGTALNIISRAGGELVRQSWKLNGATVTASRVRVVLGESATPETSVSEPLAVGVGAIKFRYLVGTEWKESFDSLGQGELPSAVEVRAWFATVNAGAASKPATDGDATRVDAQATEFDGRAPDRQRVVVFEGRMPEGTVQAARTPGLPAMVGP